MKNNGTGAVAQALRGNLFILPATIFFGVNIPLVKYLIPGWMSAFDVTVFRLCGGGILFWIASAFVRPDRIARSDYPRILLGGGIGLFAFIFLFNLSLRYADPIDVSIIMTLPPVFVILINVLFRHARPSKGEIIGVLLAFAGAAAVILAKHTGQKASDALLGTSSRLPAPCAMQSTSWCSKARPTNTDRYRCCAGYSSPLQSPRCC